jgi:hypothetical protein
MNKKGPAKKMQPRYRCDRCGKYFRDIAVTGVQNFQEYTIAGNQGTNNCVNNIPLCNNIEPIEPFEVFHETDLEIDLLLSESLAEKTANEISVAGGDEPGEETSQTTDNLFPAEKTANGISVAGGDDADMELHSEWDNIFPAGSCIAGGDEPDMEIYSEWDNLFPAGSCNFEEELDIFESQEGIEDLWLL